MSTIAWDGKTLAADRQTSSNNTAFTCHKIRKLSSGEIAGFVGSYGQGLMLVQWYEAGADPATYPKFQENKDDWTILVIVKPSGQIFEYEQLPVAIPLLDRLSAWGSGGKIALGAMAAGQTATQAIQIASQFDINTGMGVDFYQVVE